MRKSAFSGIRYFISVALSSGGPVSGLALIATSTMRVAAATTEEFATAVARAVSVTGSNAGWAS